MFTLIFCVLCLNLVPVVFNDLERDSGLFAMGGKLLNEGKIVYTDFWDNKPLGIFYILSILQKICVSQSALAALYLNSFLFYWFCFFSYKILRFFLDDRYSILGLYFIAFVASSNYYNEWGIITESFLFLPEAICGYLFISAAYMKNKKAGIALVLAGVAAWFSFLFKPVGIGSLLAVIGLLCFIYNCKTL